MNEALLDTTASRDGETLTFVCRGSAESETIEQIASTLDSVHRDALSTTTRKVIADVRGLEFASSSCLKVFVSWLQRVIELDDPQRYRVVFRSNPQHPWQRRSLGALAAFAGNVVAIETDPPAVVTQ